MEISADLILNLTIIVLVAFAAVVQRITGLGFAMVLAPFLVVFLGPHDGVMLTNFLALVAPVLMLSFVWKHIQWRRALWIGAVATVTIPFCGWAAALSPPGPLYIVVASLVLVGLSLTVVLSRATAVRDSRTARVLAGIGTGAGAVTAGVGGPAMTVYSVLTRWDVVTFAATLQPIWIVVSFASLATKWGFSEDGLPGLPWWVWLSCAVMIVAGLLVGTVLQKRIPHEIVRRTVIGMAFAGAVLALITGISTTMG